DAGRRQQSFLGAVTKPCGRAHRGQGDKVPAGVELEIVGVGTAGRRTGNDTSPRVKIDRGGVKSAGRGKIAGTIDGDSIDCRRGGKCSREYGLGPYEISAAIQLEKIRVVAAAGRQRIDPGSRVEIVPRGIRARHQEIALGVANELVGFKARTAEELHPI